jgi:hypothetical protein
MKKKGNVMAGLLVVTSVIAIVLVICYIIKHSAKKMIDIVSRYDNEPLGI